MSKKKILTFSTAYFPLVGGAEVAIREIAKRLRDDFDFVFLTSRMTRELPQVEPSAEGRVIRLGFGCAGDKFLLPFWGFWQAGRVLKGEKDACLWGMDISAGTLAAAFYKFFHPKINFIFTVQYGESPARIEKGRWGFNRQLFKFMLSQADRVTVISGYLADLVRKFGYGGEISLIPNGVDFSLFKDVSRGGWSGGKTIITTSRLVKKNGLDILLLAVAEIGKKIPEIRCLIVGDGPQKKTLQKLARDLDLGGSVEFLGQVDYENVPGYLKQADIFVRPSRSEGMGNSFVEALASGLPVIGTPVGGIPDIIEDGENGFLARPEDPHDLALKVEKILTDPVLAERMSQKGREKIREKFSWDKIAESFKKIFNSRLPLRIVLATPLYPPQIGGPAFYAQNLASEFKKNGQRIVVFSFSKFLNLPTVLRHLFYFGHLWKKACGADLVFGLDQFSVGLPCALVSVLTGKPLVMRVEGDFLWEHFVERTRRDVVLSSFNPRKEKLSLKEKIIFKLTSWVLRVSAVNVFSSEWRRRIAAENFSLDVSRTRVIRNVWPQPGKGVSFAKRKKQILWAGRVLYLKNLCRLLQAFTEVNQDYELLLVGDGPEKKRLEKYVWEKKLSGIVFQVPMSQSRLKQELQQSAFLVLPSLSEVGPNIIGESVQTQTPFIMTKESGYADTARDWGLLVDPLNFQDLKEKIKEMMREDVQEKYRQKLAVFNLGYDWPEAAQDWLKVFNEFK